MTSHKYLQTLSVAGKNKTEFAQIDLGKHISALAIMVFGAFVRLAMEGDHFFRQPMPKSSTFVLKDNKWSPNQRMELLLQGLRQWKALARDLFRGQDCMAEVTAEPHSRQMALASAAKSNLTKKVVKDRAAFELATLRAANAVPNA